MHDELAAPRIPLDVHESSKEFVTVLVVLRPSHETCTELAALHSVARTTHVDIDLVVAELGTPARRLRHQTGIAATDLQRDRVFRNVKFE
jgi:hypothetical protein